VVAVGVELDMKTRILDAAISIIESSGESGVRLRDIAAVVGVAEPSLYHHFRNREDLVVQAQASRYHRGIQTVTTPFRAEIESCTTRQDFIDLMRFFYVRSFGLEGERARLARIAVLGSAQDRPDLLHDVTEATREAMSTVVDGLRIAQVRGWVAPTFDVEAFAYWSLGNMTSRLFSEMTGDTLLIESCQKMAIEAAMAIIGAA